MAPLSAVQRTWTDCSRAAGRWLAWLDREDARIQREAVAAIRAGHNVVVYEERKAGNAPGSVHQMAPRWLVKFLGVDYFRNVVTVYLGRVSQEELIQVRRLGKVRYLLITMPTDASDAELARLRGLGNLSSLNIRGTRVSDVGMTHLKGLTNLRTLNLSGTQVTDAGLVHLKELTKLRELDLGSPQIGDAGLAHLKGLTSLSFLNLHGSPVTEAGISELKRALPKLTIWR